MIPVEVLQHLLGTWSLVRWEEWGPDGMVNYPLGEDAVMPGKAVMRPARTSERTLYETNC